MSLKKPRSKISKNTFKYYVIYKPFGVLSQFSGEEGQTLKHLFDFPRDVYPVGRLDKNSEGLLVITNDRQMNDRLLNPKFKHQRTYWAQVEGVPDLNAINLLKTGVEIKIPSGKYQTMPCEATLIEPIVPPRNPPIRVRKLIPDSWLEISLIEGKNRQVRKMCAKVGFPVLRLIRKSIVDLDLGEMQAGDVRELTQAEINAYLFS